MGALADTLTDYWTGAAENNATPALAAALEDGDGLPISGLETSLEETLSFAAGLQAVRPSGPPGPTAAPSAASSGSSATAVAARQPPQQVTLVPRRPAPPDPRIPAASGFALDFLCAFD